MNLQHFRRGITQKAHEAREYVGTNLPRLRGHIAQKAKETHEYVDKQWARLPGVAKAGIIAGAGVAVTRSAVTHVPRSQIIREWAPHVGIYSAAPAVGYVAKRKWEGQPVHKTLRKEGHKVLGLSALGGATFLGERALLHGVPTFLPKHVVPPDVREVARWRYLAHHTLPLGLLATAGQNVSKTDKKHRHKERSWFRKAALGGLALHVTTDPITHVATGSMPALAMVRHGISMGAIPALSARFGWQLGKLKEKKQRWLKKHSQRR